MKNAEGFKFMKQEKKNQVQAEGETQVPPANQKPWGNIGAAGQYNPNAGQPQYRKKSNANEQPYSGIGAGDSKDRVYRVKAPSHV